MAHLNRTAILSFILPSHPIMTTAQLEGIPNAIITRRLADADVQCAVCLEKFRLNEPGVRQLPCDHFFHTECIFPWLQNNASCPVCRAQILPDDNRVEGGQPESVLTRFFAAVNRQRELIELTRQQILAVQRQVSSMTATASTHHSQIERPSVERRQEHQGGSTSARGPSNQTTTTRTTTLTAFASARHSQVPNAQRQRTRPEAVARSTRTGGHDNPVAPVQESTNDAGRVPRRAAALRASSAIAHIYGRQHSRYGKTNRS